LNQEQEQEQEQEIRKSGLQVFLYYSMIIID